MSEQNPALHSLKVSYTNLSAQLGEVVYQLEQAQARRSQLISQMNAIMQQASTLQAAAEVQKKASESESSKS